MKSADDKNILLIISLINKIINNENKKEFETDRIIWRYLAGLLDEEQVWSYINNKIDTLNSEYYEYRNKIKIQKLEKYKKIYNNLILFEKLRSEAKCLLEEGKLEDSAEKLKETENTLNTFNEIITAIEAYESINGIKAQVEKVFLLLDKYDINMSVTLKSIISLSRCIKKSIKKNNKLKILAFTKLFLDEFEILFSNQNAGDELFAQRKIKISEKLTLIKEKLNKAYSHNILEKTIYYNLNKNLDKINRIIDHNYIILVEKIIEEFEIKNKDIFLSLKLLEENNMCQLKNPWAEIEKTFKNLSEVNQIIK